jgi:two-component system, OmpR family, sensor histidine kinase KdpD
MTEARPGTVGRRDPEISGALKRARHRHSIRRRRAQPQRSALPEQPAERWHRYLWALVPTALCTLAALPLAMRVDLINIVMVYMVGAALAGLWLGRGPSALTAVANMLAFDYFFVPPRFSLYVNDIGYLITFSAMLVVALVISNLVIVVRQQTQAANARERRTAALYLITRELAAALDVASMARATVRRVAEELRCCAQILVCDESGRLRPMPVAMSRTEPSPLNLEAAQWAVLEGSRVGVHAQQRPDDPAVYLPLAGARSTLGVLVVEPATPTRLVPEQLRLLEAFAGQLASALERARFAEIANAAHLAAEGAAMRNTLLASISHDLRTPLAAISGAGSIVGQCEFKLDAHRRVTLGKLIEDKARDMSDLLSNVLDLVRIESDPTVLARDWHNLQDLVGLAIQRNESRLTGWEVATEIPDELPMVSVDSRLFVQMLSNLLENASKYTPPGTRITISAVRDGMRLRLAVEDDGPGWGDRDPERLFEKFSRGNAESSEAGVGLGLSICRAIARLHGGDIRAAAGLQGGARFEIDLPAPMEDARLDAAACET